MDGNAILESIAREGAQAASDILEEYKGKAEELKKASAARIEKQNAALNEKIEQDGEQARDRMLRMAQLDRKKARLAAQRAVMDKAFAQALSKMESMPGENLYTFFVTLCASNAQDGAQVLIGRKNRNWYQPAFLSDVQQALEKKGKTLSLTLSDEPFEGTGFALKGEGMQIDCTLSALLNQYRAELETPVSRVLFDQA